VKKIQRLLSCCNVHFRLIVPNYNGVHVIFNGERLYSKKGDLLSVPEGMLASLPKHPFEAEIWFEESSL
jgi:hypothetical protein